MKSFNKYAMIIGIALSVSGSVFAQTASYRPVGGAGVGHLVSACSLEVKSDGANYSTRQAIEILPNGYIESQNAIAKAFFEVERNKVYRAMAETQKAMSNATDVSDMRALRSTMIALQGEVGFYGRLTDTAFEQLTADKVARYVKMSLSADSDVRLSPSCDRNRVNKNLQTVWGI